MLKWSEWEETSENKTEYPDCAKELIVGDRKAIIEKLYSTLGLNVKLNLLDGESVCYSQWIPRETTTQKIEKIAEEFVATGNYNICWEESSNETTGEN